MPPRRRRRINTKFLIGLIAAAVLVVGGFVGVYAFTKVRPGSADDDIARGTEFLQKRDYRNAMVQFGKALSKDRRDPELLLNYVECIENLEVKDSKSAQNYVQQMRKILTEATELTPDAPEPFERLMRLLMVIGRDLGQFDAWTYMHDRATGTLKVRPDMELAVKYRAIANVNRMSSLQLDDDEALQTERDLRVWLTREPDNRELTYYLALWHVNQARSLAQRRNPPAEVAQLRATAKMIMAEGRTAHPNDIERELDELDILLKLEDYKTAAPLVDILEAKLLLRPEMTKWVLQVVSAMPVVSAPNGATAVTPAENPGVFRAVTLLEAAQKVRPKDLGIKVALGRVMRVQGKVDEALALFDEARKIETSAKPLEVFRQEDFRLQARVQYADLLLAQVQTTPDPERKAELLEQADDFLRQLRTILPPENGLLQLLEGKLYMARGKWHEASVAFDRANTQFQSTNPEAALLSAQSRIAIGELGAAIGRLRTVIDLRPDFMPARYELAQVHLKLRQFARAQQQADEILARNPHDLRAHLLQAAIFAESGKLDQAIMIYERQDLNRFPQLKLPLAQLYRQDGRTDKARAILEEQFNASPRDVIVLQQLLAVAPSKEAALAYIQRAREADDTGSIAKALDILQSQLAGGLEEFIAKEIEKEADPLTRHMARYQLARRKGDMKTALAALDAAAKVSPDHPRVIETQFEHALMDKDWTRANQIARRAVDLNLDLAEGNFFFGRLAMERGEYDRAAAAFRRGLLLRPVFSDGYRQLGDAHRLGGRISEAVEAYNRALEQRPDNVAAIRGLAAIHASRREFQQALQMLQTAMSFAPNDRQLRNVYLSFEEANGDAAKALAERRRLAQADPSDYDNRRALALMDARQGRTDQAVAAMDALIGEEGLDTANLETKAAILAMANRPDEARQFLQDYIHSLGARATANDWLLLGRFLFQVNDIDSAEAAYRQAMALEDPKLRPVTRELADQLFDRQMMDACVEYYRELHKLDKSDTRVALRLAEVLLRRQDLEGAQEVLRHVDVEPTSTPSFHLLQYLIARQRGNEDTALAQINAAIEANPNQSVSYFYRADLQFPHRAREREVEADLLRAIELDPGNLMARHRLADLALRQNQPAKASQTLESGLEYAPRDAQLRLRLFNLYHDTGDLLRMGKLLDDAVRLFPNEPLWRVLQAQRSRLEKKPAAAIAHLQEALKLAPQPQTISELATLYIEAKRASEAVELFRQYAAVTTREPVLQAVRGQALLAVGRSDEAMAAFGLAVQGAANPGQLAAVARIMVKALGAQAAGAHMRAVADPNRLIWVELTLVQLELEDKRFESAYARLREIRTQSSIVTGSPEAVQFDQLLSVAAHQSKAYEDAKSAYERMLKVNPNDVLSLNNLAYLLVEMGQAEQALPLAEKAAKLAPNDENVLDTLGWVQFKAGRVEDARRTLQVSLDIKRRLPNTMHMAEVELSRGDRGAARQLFRIARDLAVSEKDDEALRQIDARLKDLGN